MAHIHLDFRHISLSALYMSSICAASALIVSPLDKFYVWITCAPLGSCRVDIPRKGHWPSTLLWPAVHCDESAEKSRRSP